MRPATAGDIDSLVDIRAATGEENQSRSILGTWLNNDATQVLCARIDEKIVGMIRITPDENTVWLNSFAVASSLHGQGIGRRMLASTLDALGRDKPILLEVETDNENALT